MSIPMDADNVTPVIVGAVGSGVKHDSAHLHVSGRATYTDDLPEPKGMLHAAFGTSIRPHAKIIKIDLSAVESAPGVIAVMVASDIPGKNDYGAILDDDPILAPDIVQYVGQPIFLVAAVSVDEARRATRLAKIEYEDLEPILDPDAAVAADSFVLPSEKLQAGDSRAALEKAENRISGRVHLGGQDQFYLEGQIALAIPREDGDFLVYSSTQHPGEVQHTIAHAIGKEAKDVVVECRRMGGAFGGKESQPGLIAAAAALISDKTGHAVKLRLDRDADMIITGKRHDFVIDYDVGFDNNGLMQGVEITYASRCGMSADLSGSINDRAMFHSDNAYYLEDVTIVSHRCKTNTVSNTAFRGFGGPQGMFGIEYVIDEIARHLALDPLDVRKTNFYGTVDRNVTPYQQTIEDNIIHEVVDSLEGTSAYRERRKQIEAWNRDNIVLKKGIALTPVKFGIAFTATHLNQAGALLHVYTDGTVHLNHGGTEMGQGLFTKVAQVVAEELQIDVHRIKITASDTSKVPNASATAASSGTDLNGKAAQNAALKIKTRLTDFAAEHFSIATNDIEFRNNQVRVGKETVSFVELVQLAYFGRVSLSATGFYRTQKINYDRSTFTGRPFLYYAYGAACAEVLIDTLTGEYRLLRADILHDCGKSLNPAIDMGQVEGGFIQGVGWLTSEELWWNEDGELKTHAPSTYKIPTCSDVPADLRVAILESAANREETIHRSKAVGEPPLMLALSVFHAVKDAVAHTAQGDSRLSPVLHAPVTPEAILTSIEELQSRGAA